jgi:hypothetical protein
MLSTGPIPPEVPELGQDMKLDRSWRLRIFPVGLRGTAETIETERALVVRQPVPGERDER